MASRKKSGKVTPAATVASVAETTRRLNHDPRLIAALQSLRRVLPGDSGSEALVAKRAARSPRMVGRLLEEVSTENPGALGEAGLGALQLWEAISEAQGRGKGRSDVAIAFTDLVDFSSWALTAGDDAAIELLREVSDAIEPPVKDNGGEVVKRLGDGMMAVFGDPEAGVRAILAGRQALRKIEADGYRPHMRAGIHVGRPRKVKGDYFGVDVNIAARVADGARGDELLLSEHALDVIGPDAVQVRPRQRLRAKGVPEDFRVYAVTGT